MDYPGQEWPMRSWHSVRVTLFLILSALDLFLTWRLLREGAGCVYEINPIANALLTSFGMTGLVLYKLGMVVNTLGLCAIISLYRPAASRFVLTFACFVLTGVVVYSGYIWGFGEIQDLASWPEAEVAVVQQGS